MEWTAQEEEAKQINLVLTKIVEHNVCEEYVAIATTNNYSNDHNIKLYSSTVLLEVSMVEINL